MPIRESPSNMQIDLSVEGRVNASNTIYLLKLWLLGLPVHPLLVLSQGGCQLFLLRPTTTTNVLNHLDHSLLKTRLRTMLTKR